MRIQIYIITILMSLIGWGFAFDITRDAYRAGQEQRLLPNLQIHRHLRELDLI